MAAFLGLVEFYRLGLDYPERYPSLIEAVTREDVQRVARRYLQPKDHSLVIVGNLSAAGVE
jgi:zinc protease